MVCRACRFEEKAGSIALIDELFQQLKPGLSSYGTDAVGAADSLDRLLSAALEKVCYAMPFQVTQRRAEGKFTLWVVASSHMQS